MMIAMTPAKIGRRMKKWLNCIGVRLDYLAAKVAWEALGDEGGGALGVAASAARTWVTRGFTFEPGIANWTPWTTTRSARVSPERMTRRLPTSGPVSTGFTATVSSLPTVS